MTFRMFALAAVLAATTLPQVADAALTAAQTAARGKDTQLDARRKGPELVAFAQVKPGQRVLDLIPGGGYFTRLFSLNVGPTGKVYALWPSEYDKVSQPDSNVMRTLAGKAPFNNIQVLVQPAKTFSAPEPLDLVFTSQNYHDYPDKFMGPTSPAVLNAAVFKALKPGGLYVIVDHRAAAGSGISATETLHRIDIEAVKTQVKAAGFVLDGESKVLANPKDTLKVPVFDKSVRGSTDQFALRFRKPR